MKKNWLHYIILLALLIPSTAILAQDQPTDIDTARIEILLDGESVQGQLLENVTAVLYGFNATEGDEVIIDMVQTGRDAELNPFVVVLGAAGELIGADDDSGETELAAQAVVTIPQSGSYFILASSFEAVEGIQTTFIEDPQPYTITVRGNTQPEGTNPEELIYYRADLTYNTPPAMQGYSTPEEPVYYQVFEGQQDDIVTVSASSEDIDTVVMLFDPYGNRVAINDDAETLMLPNFTDSAIEEYTLPYTASYMVWVSDVYFYAVDEDYIGGTVDVLVSR